MRKGRVISLIALGMAVVAAGPAMARSSTVTYTPGYSGGYRYDVTSCADPQPATCAVSGSFDMNGGGADAGASIVRTQTQVATGDDHAQRAWLTEQAFRLAKPATQVQAVLHVTDIGGTWSASAPSGTSTAQALLDAYVRDSGCATADCGSTTSTKWIIVGFQRVQNGVDITSFAQQPTDARPAQDIVLTLKTSDGSPLPAGRIAIGLRVTADAFLTSCIGPSCANPTPHYGSATATAKATLASIDVTVS